MKLKNLIYICVVIVLIITCVGLIYSNLNNESKLTNESDTNITKNSSDIDNISISDNSSVNNSDNLSSIENIKHSNVPKKINKPTNIPKKSRLTYNQAFKLASKAAKGAAAPPSVKVYVISNGYEYNFGKLYWRFKIYTIKNNKFLGEFVIDDSTGKATIF